MLDSKSIDVISRFKQNLLLKNVKHKEVNSFFTNRGNKLDLLPLTFDNLKTKIVEYSGLNHLVLTNETIERSNYKNKYGWKKFNKITDDIFTFDEEEEEDCTDFSDEENPLKTIKFTEILAPLSYPIEIVTHQSILKIFNLQIFNNLAIDLIVLIETEQKNLNKINKLLLILNGEDYFYYLDDNFNQNNKNSLNLDSDDNENHIKSTLSQDEMSENLEIDTFFELPKTLKKSEINFNKKFNDEFLTLKKSLIKYLLASKQRHNEYINNLIQIRNSLIRADRLKNNLLKWGEKLYNKDE